ncbi:MAG: hypothetical protein M0029_04675 [Actinomycetota bacterium]|nr:hypothetical protein [Actinomycetota bacterium]
MTGPLSPSALARAVVHELGGRYSVELGVDVDGGDTELERWSLAATLFGTRISAGVAARTFAGLAAAGVGSIEEAGRRDGDELVALLDAGGYGRYDFRTATRLHQLAAAIGQRYGGRAADIGRAHHHYQPLAAALDALPGWGPVTVGLFLRELRGVWPGATPPLDASAAAAGRHLGLLATDDAQELTRLRRLASGGHVDVRDLESALVRLALHHRRVTACPGGPRCVLLAGPEPPTGSG